MASIFGAFNHIEILFCPSGAVILMMLFINFRAAHGGKNTNV